jgi:uncharacterized protein with von Willebrand factor type A (vWA) domain
MRSEREASLKRLTVSDDDLAYEVGRFPRALFRAELNTPGPMRESVDRRKAEHRDGHGPWVNFTREVFGRLLDVDTKPLGEPKAEWKKVHDQMEQLPEWALAKSQVKNDPYLTSIATASLMDAVSDAVPTMYDTDAMKREIEMRKHCGADTSSQERKLERMEAAQLKRAAKDGAVRHAARKGLRSALEELENVQSAIAGLGADKSPPGSPQRIAATRMLSNPATRRLAAMAGRMRATVQKRRGDGEGVGRSEIVAVELGGDIERLLPSEIGKLADPDLEWLLMQDVMEKRALQYELSGTDVAESGPILFVVDESGSMRGARIEYAKAIMLGMMQVAISEQRSFACIRFSRGKPDVHVFPDPGNPDMDDLRSCLEGFRDGGTNIPEAMSAAQRLITEGEWPGGHSWPDAAKADVVLLTDGSSYEIGSEASFETEAQLYTIGICTRIPQWLRDASAEVLELDEDAARSGDASWAESLAS